MILFSLFLISNFISFYFSLAIADARLIFTTEADGVNSEEYHFDIDDTSADNIDLAFGSGVTALLRYSKVSTKFIFNQDVDFSGKQLLDFLAENDTTTNKTASCTAGEAGRMYYATDTTNLYYCNGSSWVTSSNIAADSITGTMLAPAVAGVGLVQDGSGNLDVNPGTGLEISGDTIAISAGGVDTTQLADGAVTYAKIDSFSIDTDLSDGATASTLTSSAAVKSYVDSEVGALASGLVYQGTLAAGTTPDLRGAATGNTYVDALGLTSDYSQGDFFKITTDGNLTDGTNNFAVKAGDMVIVNKIVQHNLINVSTDLDLIDNTETADLLTAGALSSGQLFVGDGTSTPNPVSLSGDLAITSAGLTTIQDGAVDTSDILGLASGAFILGVDGTTGGNITTTMTGDVVMDNTGATTIQSNVIGTLEVTDGTLTLADFAARNVAALISPEYPNFTVHADGSNNRGTLESDNDSASTSGGVNYYKWSSNKTSLNDYDLVFKWVVPENFQGFQGSTPIQIDFKTTTTSNVDNAVDFFLYNAAGTQITLTGAADLQSAVADTFETHDLSFTDPFTSADAGKTVTIRVRFYAKSTGDAYVSNVQFNYIAK